MPHTERSFFLGIVCLVLVLTIVPFLLAAQAGGDGYQFDGILLNPVDGHTYLAKMYQGFRGDWRFTLPYTADPGEGAYLNLFYLFLGHLARLTHLSLPLTFSIARIIAGVFLLFALHRFFVATIPKPRPRRVAFALSALGSGVGWILVPTGLFTADFWVAETYPFLSMYSNPHFSLGLALVLWLLTPALPTSGFLTGNGWLAALATLILSMVNPFGVVVVVVVMAGWQVVTGWEALRRSAWGDFCRASTFKRVLWTVAGGVPMLAYQVWAIRTDPSLSGWDAQNLTPTPPWWDVLIAFSPALWLALVGWRSVNTTPPARLFVVWVVLGLFLIVVPFGLQRRFMMGLYIPLAGLAATGLETLSQGKRSRARIGIVVLFILALPTNLIVILAGQSGARARDLLLYRTQAEALALRWLETQTPPDALVLAAPDTGLIIPAFTGRQVIYGHPFETVQAEAEKQAVTDFYQSLSETEANQFLSVRRIDFIFYGPRERRWGTLPISEGIKLVFETGDVQIYQVEP
jgi:hypothetical protein